MNDIQIKISREDKLIALGVNKKIPKSQISESFLDELYNINVIEKQKNIKIPKSSLYIKKPKNSKISKDDEKYKVTIEFLNNILEVLGKKEIKEITEFKDIKRDDLLNDSCKKILDKHLDNIVKQFGKTKIYYCNRKNITTYILTILRNIITLCGYSFISKKIIKNNIIDNKNYKQEYTLTYYISE